MGSCKLAGFGSVEEPGFCLFYYLVLKIQAAFPFSYWSLHCRSGGRGDLIIGVTTSVGLPAVMKTLPRAPGRAAEPPIKSVQVRARADAARREVQEASSHIHIVHSD